MSKYHHYKGGDRRERGSWIRAALPWQLIIEMDLLRFQQKKNSGAARNNCLFVEAHLDYYLPFDLNKFSLLRATSTKAKSSLEHLKSTFESFNHSLSSLLRLKNNSRLSLKAGSLMRRISRSYEFLRTIYGELELLPLMNFSYAGSVDKIINSLSMMILEKEGRGKMVQSTIARKKHTDEDQGRIFSKLDNRMLTSTATSKPRVRLNQYLGSLNDSSVVEDQSRAERKRRLYGSNQPPSRAQHSFEQQVSNNKLLWSWTIKEKCKQFSKTNEASMLRNKTIHQTNKLLQHSYLSKKESFCGARNQQRYTQRDSGPFQNNQLTELE